MQVQNPILTGFNPDPSIIFVKPYYYIATSTFEYYAGVQIHRSIDLVNWEVVSRPIDDSKINMRGITESCGVWAPDLSYHNGLFYLVYSNVTLWCGAPFKDVSNYIITASEVEGEWSKPVYINSSGFDASLFHEGDKKYFVNMEWDYRQEERDAFTGILCQEIDKDSFALIGKPQKIFYGTNRKLVEGPHIYKRGEYYYLLTAEGGTVLTHAATLCRSKSIFGEYELHPNMHLVTSDNQNCKLKKAGHASLCHNDKDEWYMAHLVGRPLVKDKCPLGRETALQNIEWVQDWPYIKGGSIAPRDSFEIPTTVKRVNKSKEILFDNKSLRLRWQSLRTSIQHKYTVNSDTSITLTGGSSYMSCMSQSLLVYRQQDFEFCASVRVSFKPTIFTHLAGMVYRYNEHNQYLLLLTCDEHGKQHFTLNSLINGKHTVQKLDYVDGDVYIQLQVKLDKGQFAYSLDNNKFINIGNPIDVSTLSDENADPLGFTGAFVGIYCGDFELAQCKATFSNFVYSSASHQ